MNIREIDKLILASRQVGVKGRSAFSQIIGITLFGNKNEQKLLSSRIMAWTENNWQLPKDSPISL